MRKLLLFVSFVVLSLSVIAQVPTITSFSPASAEVGASVTITGTNFDATPANNIVYFGSVKGVTEDEFVEYEPVPTAFFAAT